MVDLVDGTVVPEELLSVDRAVHTVVAVGKVHGLERERRGQHIGAKRTGEEGTSGPRRRRRRRQPPTSLSSSGAPLLESSAKIGGGSSSAATKFEMPPRKRSLRLLQLGRLPAPSSVSWGRSLSYLSPPSWRSLKTTRTGKPPPPTGKKPLPLIDHAATSTSPVTRPTPTLSGVIGGGFGEQEKLAVLSLSLLLGASLD